MTTNVDDLADIQASYPVIVEYTHRHIVWIEAHSPKDAAASLQNEPYEKTNDHDTLASSWWKVSEPDRWDWDDIYPTWNDGPYRSNADAHVDAHRAELHRREREAQRAACTAAGHPNTREPLSGGRIWCGGCTQYLTPATAEEPTR